METKTQRLERLKLELIQRIKVYKEVLKILKICTGFCHAFHEVTEVYQDSSVHLELYELRPKTRWLNNDGFWFVSNSTQRPSPYNGRVYTSYNSVTTGIYKPLKTNIGYIKRRKLLKQAIEVANLKLKQYEQNK